MAPTPFPEANAALERLVPSLQTTLGSQLVGLYLYGSCVHGAFEEGRSDVDLLAAVSPDVDDVTFRRLLRMHASFAAEVPAWSDRIEVQYVGLDALRTFKERTSRIAAISPGDPFSWKEAGNDWSMNWYDVLRNGVVLQGPAPTSIIAPVSEAEYVGVVRQSALDWEGRLEGMALRRGAQAYVIVTLCRVLMTVRHGGQPSKSEAAHWAERALPEWASVISRALAWSRDARRNDPPAERDAIESTRAFARHAIDLVRRERC